MNPTVPPVYLHGDVTSTINAAAIAVHRSLGPGFLESIYEEALCVELDRRCIVYQRQLVVDSSGLKVYGEGEWKVRTHGKDKRRTWRKIHLAIDRKSHEVTAVRLTESNHHDCEEMQSLLDETGPCDRVLADGAYDNQKSYDAAESVGARALIPPRSGAALAHTTNRKAISWGMVQRNANIHGVWRLGRKEWKMTSGYHDRSLAETGIGRFKAIFGPGLRSRRMERPIAEARTKCRVLNRLTRLGMPVSERVP